MSHLQVDLEVPGRVRAAFTAARGEVVAVIGPNGAGKSSLVRAVAGLVAATGSVQLEGRDLGRLPSRDRSVGMVFQDQLLFPHLTSLANVAYGPRARGAPRRTSEQLAATWLERLDVGDLRDRRPGQLSGGQAQRVAIARALATDPDLLLLDEPMSGLDVGVAMTLRLELARHLAAYDGVALLVTHDAIDALTLADRVLVLDEGRVAQLGTPEEVTREPATEHVARLVGLNVLREDDRLRWFRPEAVTVSVEAPHGSARNTWPGEVGTLTPHGSALRVTIRTDAGPQVLADVTPAAAVELGLAPGHRVWASVKETSVQSSGEART